MGRLISFLLLLSLVFPCLLLLTACKDGGDPTPPAGGGSGQKPEPEKPPALYIPAPGSFEGQSTEDFSTFVYSAPNTDALIAALGLAAEQLKNQSATYAEALATVEAAERLFSEYSSMLSYAQLMQTKDKTNAFFAGEYKRLYASSPSVAFAMEKLFCAAAASPHARELAETKYFASDLCERYQGGGLYNETTLPLFEREAELLLGTQSISPDNVTVTYGGLTDTVTNIVNRYLEIYGEVGAEYLQARLRCQTLYAKAANKKRADIFLSLVRVRREIADALGYASFAEVAAMRQGYSADLDTVRTLLDAIEARLLPVYQELSASDFFSSGTGKVETIKFPETMLNTLTAFYEKTGGKAFEGYNYLLNRSLFTLTDADSNSTDTTLALHFPSRAQGYLYIGAQGTAKDYLSVAGALGNALYAYQCAGGSTLSSAMRTPELLGAYESALRLLTLRGMEEQLSKTEDALNYSTYQILEKSEIYSLLRTMLTECMRTEIELAVYGLKLNEITEQTVNGIVARAAERFDCFEMKDGAPLSLSLSTEGLLDANMFHSPTRSLSGVTSAYIAIALFLKETETEGAGFAAYEALLAKTKDGATFAEALAAMGLSCPADDAVMADLFSSLFTALTGYSYSDLPPAATAALCA